MLENNLDKVNWSMLCINPNAIKLLDSNKINWAFLSLNPNAIDLLKNNQDKIDSDKLSLNPSIFEDEPMPTI